MTVHFRDGMTAGDIAQRFHHAWPTISRHLGILRSAGLLTQEKQGRSRLYRVDHAKLALVREWMAWLEDPGPAAKRTRATRERRPEPVSITEKTNAPTEEEQ
jgi:DNA-binding transcriptional ArsR family regulator